MLQRRFTRSDGSPPKPPELARPKVKKLRLAIRRSVSDARADLDSVRDDDGRRQDLPRSRTRRSSRRAKQLRALRRPPAVRLGLQDSALKAAG